jgi:MerR family transcriptional regulator/heat shock protein HspR
MNRKPDQPVYIISVAAQLVEMHPQTLRLYERLGLLSPARSGHNIRLYSDRDIDRAHQIKRLTSEGVNLAGVDMVLKLLETMNAMRREMEREMERRQEEMTQEISRLRRQMARQSAGR